jgi:hypothetical protein
VEERGGLLIFKARTLFSAAWILTLNFKPCSPGDTHMEDNTTTLRRNPTRTRPRELVQSTHLGRLSNRGSSLICIIPPRTSESHWKIAQYDSILLGSLHTAPLVQEAGTPLNPARGGIPPKIAMDLVSMQILGWACEAEALPANQRVGKANRRPKYTVVHALHDPANDALPRPEIPRFSSEDLRA